MLLRGCGMVAGWAAKLTDVVALAYSVAPDFGLVAPSTAMLLT